MRILIFSTTFVCNISHSKKNWARYNKNVHLSSYNIRYSCQTLMTLECSQQILKNTQIKFHEYPSSGAERTGRKINMTMLPLSAILQTRLKWVELNLHSPSGLHDVYKGNFTSTFYFTITIRVFTCTGGSISEAGCHSR